MGEQTTTDAALVEKLSELLDGKPGQWFNLMVTSEEDAKRLAPLVRARGYEARASSGVNFTTGAASYCVRCRKKNAQKRKEASHG